MWWQRWWRRARHRRRGIEGVPRRLADGDQVPIDGFPTWAVLLTKEYPIVPVAPPLYPEVTGDGS